MKPKQKIKAIIFDYGGVYYTYDEEIVLKTYAKELNVTLPKMRKAWNLKLHSFENGLIREYEFWNSILNFLKLKYNNKKLHDLFINHGRPIHAVHKLVKKLRQKYVVGLLSNQCEWLHDIERKQHFISKFDFAIFSYKVHMRKPEPKIFKLLIAKTKCKPSEIVFIDDYAEYGPAVRRAGINFICYKNPRQLVKALRKLGVKI